SRYGLVAFASSLDVVGPFGRSVRDAARILEAIAGSDPRDATCAARPVDEYEDACAQTIRGKAVGVPRVLLEGADEGVRASFDDALTRLKDAGATIVDVELPHASVAVSVYYLVAPAEASSNLSRFDGVRFGARGSEASLAELYETTRAKFGDEVKRRIMLGTYALSAGYYDAYYGKATKVRSLIRADYEVAFEQCDVVATPTAPTTAFALGSRTDPLSMYLSDVYTLPASLAGLPAISVPARESENLPVGLQLVGNAFDEATLFAFGGALEAS
ncbi:MAG: amidase family protein, partial [Myxococcota bacterium]